MIGPPTCRSMARDHPDWMTPVDVAILELLHNRGGHSELRLNPKSIAANIEYTEGTVRQHMMELWKHV